MSLFSSEELEVLKQKGLNVVEYSAEQALDLGVYLLDKALPALEQKIIASPTKVDDMFLPLIVMGKNYMVIAKAWVKKWIDKINGICDDCKS